MSAPSERMPSVTLQPLVLLWNLQQPFITLHSIKHGVCPKWHPIPYRVHYFFFFFLPGPIESKSNVPCRELWIWMHLECRPCFLWLAILSPSPPLLYCKSVWDLDTSTSRLSELFLRLRPSNNNCMYEHLAIKDLLRNIQRHCVNYVVWGGKNVWFFVKCVLVIIPEQLLVVWSFTVSDGVYWIHVHPFHSCQWCCTWNPVPLVAL